MSSKYFPARIEKPRGVARIEASKHTKDAIKFLADTMHDVNAEMPDRIRCALALVERSDGKPHQSITVDEGDASELVLIGEAEAAALMLEEFGDRGALPGHSEGNGSNGEPS